MLRRCWRIARPPLTPKRNCCGSRHTRRSRCFHYGGDLWIALRPAMATRLTSHPGVELFARFSPDGKWIAFTGQYDGDEQVYVVPTTGGEPRQLTFYPARGPLPPRWGWENQVYGWSKDGKQVYRSSRTRGPSVSPGFTRFRSTVARLSRCRCLKRVPPTTRPTAPRWCIRRRRAISLREAIQRRPGQSSLHLRSQEPQCEEDHK